MKAAIIILGLAVLLYGAWLGIQDLKNGRADWTMDSEDDASAEY